jgi:TATA-box binding protein (TBP) (component of TFIID and TFIIIB)
MSEEKKRGRKRNKEIVDHYDGAKRRATESCSAEAAVAEYDAVTQEIVDDVKDRCRVHLEYQKSQNQHRKRTLKILKSIGKFPGEFFTALLEEFGIERKEVKENRIPGSDNPQVEKYLMGESEIILCVDGVRLKIDRISTYFTWHTGCRRIDLRNLAIKHPHMSLEYNSKGFKASSSRYAIDNPFPTSGFFRIFKNGICGLEGPICENAANLLAMAITVSLARTNLPVGFFNFRMSNQMFSVTFKFPINLAAVHIAHPLIFKLPERFPAGFLRPNGAETNPLVIIFGNGRCVFIGVENGEESLYCVYVYDIVRNFCIENSDPIVQAYHKGDRRHHMIKGRADSVMYLEAASLTTESADTVLRKSNALTDHDYKIVAQQALEGIESVEERRSIMGSLFPEHESDLFLEYTRDDDQ